jgi:hypothetical protein
MTGAVLVQDLGAEVAVRYVGRPALYLSLFETSTSNTTAGRSLLQAVMNRSSQLGYEGFVYGDALPQAVPIYRYFGAVQITSPFDGQTYMLFDPAKLRR